MIAIESLQNSYQTTTVEEYAKNPNQVKFVLVERYFNGEPTEYPVAKNTEEVYANDLESLDENKAEIFIFDTWQDVAKLATELYNLTYDKQTGYAYFTEIAIWESEFPYDVDLMYVDFGAEKNNQVMTNRLAAF